MVTWIFGEVLLEYSNKLRRNIMASAQDRINELKREVQLEQKRILLKNYEIQILELEDKITFTKEAKAKLEEELTNLGG